MGVPVIYSLGIVDILQQWTLKKKAAHVIKKVSIGCCHEIDTEPPNYYRGRFARKLQALVGAIESSAQLTMIERFYSGPAGPQSARTMKESKDSGRMSVQAVSSAQSVGHLRRQTT